MKRFITLASAATAVFLAATPAHAADAAAAEALMKKSGCMKCHSVSAKKEGPSFKETAAKYKGQADAEAKLTTHLTTAPKMPSGEAHPSLKTKDAAAITNAVQFILAQ